ncbi:MAG: DUF1592 domain-containing protein, partial [Opitutales bacterium]
LTKELRRAAQARRSTGGQVVIRRLNRYEYGNTMRDLLGMNFDFARPLPPEPSSADGFKNNGRSLRMSPEQLEYYLQIARDALSKAIVEGEAPETYKERTEQSVKGAKDKIGHHSLLPGAQFWAKFDNFPREGQFVVRVHLTAKVPEEAGWPSLQVTMGVRADTQAAQRPLAVVDLKGGKQELEFRGWIEDFPLPGHNPKFPGLLIRLTNTYDDGSGFFQRNRGKKKKKNALEDPDLARQPVAQIHAVEFEGPVFASWPPPSHLRLVGEPGGETEESRAKKALKEFMPRAWRRPVTAGEVDSMLVLYRKVRPLQTSFEAAMRETLALVLISPDFLYLLEPGRPKGDRALNDYEVASRLSYFLWSTMPDEELFALAKAGKLRQPKELEKQVRRMLADKRSWEFVSHFTDQWLNLSGLTRVAVNPQYHPDFDDHLKPDMKLETQHFFAEVVRANASALQLVDSDFAMLNRALARHYGIDGPRGSAFERVALKEGQHRGGVLTQASVLLANSDGEQSHPIRRAVWLRDRILGDPPAPPPPDVPELETNAPKMKNLSIREQMELHREKAACADCHRDIDPWGIAFEEYDAVGLWRDLFRKNPRAQPTPLEAKAELPDGSILDGMAGLKKHLLTHEKERFAKALTEKLLAYALGRSLEFTDEATVAELAEGFARNDHRIPELLAAIVKNDVFLKK